ncbi:MAG: Kelch repeat-containing protein [Candidatus Binatia bacterium]
MRSAAGILLGLTLITPGLARAGHQHGCPGDCDASGGVSLAEVERVAREIFTTGGCPAADADGDGAVTAADLLQVVLARVDPNRCAVATPIATGTVCATPTPTSTPSTPMTRTPPAGTPRSTWIPQTPLAQGARQEVAVAALGARVLVIGGLNSSVQGSRAVEVYDTESGEWSAVASLPDARHHIGADTLGGFVYAVGGFVRNTFSPTADSYRYDPGANAWAPIDSLPTPRGALALVALDGRLHAVGGSGIGGSVGDHAVYDPTTGVWASTFAPLPTGRNHLAAVALDGYMYVIGGRIDGGGMVNSDALDRYDPVEDAWEALAPMPTARSGHAAAVLGARIVVMGGEVNPSHPDRVFPHVEIYDPAADRWTSIDPMPVPRHGIGAASIGGLIYVPGGAVRAGFGATAHTDALMIE